jgi:hypothetical protein
MFWRRSASEPLPEAERSRGDLEFMDLFVKALYVHDQAGRLRQVNEPRGGPAPAFVLGRTGRGNLWRFRYDLPSALARRLDALANTEPPLSSAEAPPVALTSIRRTFADTGEKVSEHAGPAFRFPERLKRPKGLVEVGEANEQLLRFGFPDLIPSLQARQPLLAVVRDGVAISVCYSMRLTKTAAVAGVRTLSRYREQGHGTAVTLGWAAEARGRGLVPLFGAEWDNRGSLGIARRLQLIQFGSGLYYTTG